MGTVDTSNEPQSKFSRVGYQELTPFTSRCLSIGQITVKFYKIPNTHHFPDQSLPVQITLLQNMKFLIRSTEEERDKYSKAVLGIRMRRIRMFLGLPDPDPLVRGTDPDTDPSLFS